MLGIKFKYYIKNNILCIYSRLFAFQPREKARQTYYSLLYTNYSILRDYVNFNIDYCALFLIYIVFNFKMVSCSQRVVYSRKYLIPPYQG